MTSRRGHRAAVRFRCAVVACAAAVLLLSGPVAVQADGAYFMGLSSLSPGIKPFDATGVSYDGSVIVGLATSASGGLAYRLENQQFTDLGDLPGGLTGSKPLAVSADGSTVVGYSYATTERQAFRWTAMNGMVGLGATPTTAEAVSADGSDVVGWGGGAFRWTTMGGIVPLGILPGYTGSEARGVSGGGSVIVGTAFNSATAQAFRWTSAAGMVGLGDFSGGDFDSTAAAVSADGSIVVGGGTRAAGVEAFRWTQATGMVGLGHVPDGLFYSTANGVSGDGSIVVGLARPSSTGSDEAFVWDELRGMRRLYDFLSIEHGLELTGWRLLTTHISGDGRTFVGQAFNPSGQFEAYVAQIPEPASLALLSLAAMAMSTRRRNQRPR